MIDTFISDIPIFVVNRQDRISRFINTISELSKINLQQIVTRVESPTIDWIKANREKFVSKKSQSSIEKGPEDGMRIPSWGACGCTFTHNMCWKRIIKQKLEYAFIIEDDFHLVDKDIFLDKFNDCLRYIRNPYLVGRAIMFDSYIKNKDFNGKNCFVPANGPFYFTHAYLVDYQGALCLSQFVFPIKMQLDAYMGTLSVKKSKLFECYVQYDAGTCQEDNLSDCQSSGNYYDNYIKNNLEISGVDFCDNFIL